MGRDRPALNNAGLAPPTDPLPDTEWQRVEDVIDTNVPASSR